LTQIENAPGFARLKNVWSAAVLTGNTIFFSFLHDFSDLEIFSTHFFTF
jgi:hypothetical protein